MYQKSAKRDLFLQMMDDGSSPNPNKPCCSRSVLNCTHTGRTLRCFQLVSWLIVMLPAALHCPAGQRDQRKQNTNPAVLISTSNLFCIICEVQSCCAVDRSPRCFIHQVPLAFISTLCLARTTYLWPQRDKWNSVTPCTVRGLWALPLESLTKRFTFSY